MPTTPTRKTWLPIYANPTTARQETWNVGVILSFPLLGVTLGTYRFDTLQHSLELAVLWFVICLFFLPMYFIATKEKNYR